jgi:hypothetical protein
LELQNINFKCFKIKGCFTAGYGASRVAGHGERLTRMDQEDCTVLLLSASTKKLLELRIIIKLKVLNINWREHF